MLWNVDGVSIAGPWLSFEPVRVLYEFDGPRIFTFLDAVGHFYLAYMCGEDEETLRFLVVPFSDELELRLTTGSLNLRDALLRPLAWVVDLHNDWTLAHAWKVDTDNLPANILPRAGVMLWSHLKPTITTPPLQSWASETRIPDIDLTER